MAFREAPSKTTLPFRANKITIIRERAKKDRRRTDKSRAPALAYLRASSAANVGANEESCSTASLPCSPQSRLSFQRVMHLFRCALAGLHGGVEIAALHRGHHGVFAREETVPFRLLLDAEHCGRVPDRQV